MPNKATPVLRIFDYQKTIEFYVEWLEFKIDWEHKFDDNSPIYMQVSKDGVELHLTEHYGDCCPGGKAFIIFENLRAYHKILIDKNYKYYKPGLGMAPWNALCMDVTDPFGNNLSFTEPVK